MDPINLLGLAIWEAADMMRSQAIANIGRLGLALRDAGRCPCYWAGVKS
jgi:hypothetical protein